jgi:hypothetical protein
MQINTPTLQIVWENGSHTANVYNYLNNELDAFTFSFDKNKASALDFLGSTLRYLEEV